MAADWLFDYLSDSLSVLPEEDRQLLADFWQSIIQVVAGLQQRALEVDLNRYVDYVQPFRTERWNVFTLNLSTASIAEENEALSFSAPGAAVSLSRSALLRWGLLLSRVSDETPYTLNTDYTLDFLAGTITHIPGGAIPVNAQLNMRFYYMTDIGPFAGFPYAIGIEAKTHSIPTLQTQITPTAQTVTLYENVDYLVGSGFLSFRQPPPTNLWAERTLLDDQTPFRNFGVLIDFILDSSPEYVNALRGLYYAYFTGSQQLTIESAVALLLGLPVAHEAGTITAIIDTLVSFTITKTATPYRIEVSGAPDLRTLLQADGLVRVTGVGSYTVAIKVAEVGEDFVLLKSDAFDNFDPAPAGALLTIPRQLRYVDADNRVRVAEIYAGLVLKFGVGDQVAKWNSFVEGAKIIDKTIDPDFVANEVGRAGIQRFLTDLATTGTAAGTDETKALQTLTSHLWVMQLNGSIFNYIISFGDIRTFLDRIKPKYTEYILQILEQFDETLVIGETLEPLELTLDLTYTVDSNFPNHSTWAMAIPIVSWDSASRIVTVDPSYDLTGGWVNPGETIEFTGLSAAVDNATNTVDALLSPTTFRTQGSPSIDYPGPVGAEVDIQMTLEEYNALGGFPELNIGAGHVHIDEGAVAEVVFATDADEFKADVGPTYFIGTASLTAKFLLWVEVGDSVVVTGTVSNNTTFTVVAVVDDVTLQVAEVVTVEGPGAGGTMTITKTIAI